MTKPPSSPTVVARVLGVVLEVTGWIVLALILANAVLAFAGFLPPAPDGTAEPAWVRTLRDANRPLHAPFAAVLQAADKPLAWGRIALPPALCLLALMGLRAGLYYAGEALEKSAERARSPRSGEELREAERRAAARRVAVRAYADAQAVLESSRIELTFLSLDIVGSTKMKIGEDSVLVEQAFADYMAMVNEILGRNAAWKTTWTPDGQMAAFKTPESAVRAGQEVLSALARFNREISRIRTPFRLRAGAHLGVVSTDEKTPMEKISDFSIDVAGHMQKHSAVDALSISEKLFERLENRDGFVETGETVDGFRVHAWSPSTVG